MMKAGTNDGRAAHSVALWLSCYFNCFSAGAGPVQRPRNWLEWVNRPLTVGELAAVRQSVVRGTHYGEAGWIERTAKRLGLESTLRPRGRPRKKREDI